MDHDNPLMMEKGEYEIARPNAGSLMQSLRAFGYDIATAIADLIDNSITARSDRISMGPVTGAWFTEERCSCM